jgi:integrase
MARKLPDGMRTRPGRRGYYADFAVAGRRRRDYLGTDYQAACEILAELKRDAFRGKFSLDPADCLLDRLRQQYLAHCRQQLKASTVGCYTRWLDAVLPALGVTRASQLTIPLVLGYRESRLEDVCARTVNAEVAVLSSMLTWGVQARLLGDNPIRGLKPLPHRPREGRPLTDEEVPLLLDASPPQWRDIWYAFLTTGLRKGELAGLEFSHEFLDWENREIIVPPWLAKNKTGRRIPMDGGLETILRRLEQERHHRRPGQARGRVSAARIRARFTRDRVFVTTENTPLDHGSNLRLALVRCLAKAGIARQTFAPDGRLLEIVDLHSLRRTFTTSLITSGADPATVQQLLGHKTLQMTMQIYAKSRPQTKREAVARLPYAAGKEETKPVE